MKSRGIRIPCRGWDTFPCNGCVKLHCGAHMWMVWTIQNEFYPLNEIYLQRFRSSISELHGRRGVRCNWHRRVVFQQQQGIWILSGEKINTLHSYHCVGYFHWTCKSSSVHIGKRQMEGATKRRHWRIEVAWLVTKGKTLSAANTTRLKLLGFFKGHHRGFGFVAFRSDRIQPF